MRRQSDGEPSSDSARMRFASKLRWSGMDHFCFRPENAFGSTLCEHVCIVRALPINRPFTSESKIDGGFSLAIVLSVCLQAFHTVFLYFNFPLSGTHHATALADAKPIALATDRLSDHLLFRTWRHPSRARSSANPTANGRRFGGRTADGSGSNCCDCGPQFDRSGRDFTQGGSTDSGSS